MYSLLGSLCNAKSKYRLYNTGAVAAGLYPSCAPSVAGRGSWGWAWRLSREKLCCREGRSRCCEECSSSFSHFVIWMRAVTIQAHLLQPDLTPDQTPARETLLWWELCCSPSPFPGCWLWVQIPTSTFGSVPGSKGNIPLSPLPGALPTPCRSLCPEQGVWITLVPPGSSTGCCAQGQDSRGVPRRMSQAM